MYPMHSLVPAIHNSKLPCSSDLGSAFAGRPRRRIAKTSGSRAHGACYLRGAELRCLGATCKLGSSLASRPCATEDLHRPGNLSRYWHFGVASLKLGICKRNCQSTDAVEPCRDGHQPAAGIISNSDNLPQLNLLQACDRLTRQFCRRPISAPG